jgi:hypothetical protein
MASLTLTEVAIESLIPNPNQLVLELPKDYDKGKFNIQRQDKHLRTDLLYKVEKIGQNAKDFLGIDKNYFILLQPNLTVITILIEGLTYILIDMTDVLVAFKEKKQLVHVEQ